MRRTSWMMAACLSVLLLGGLAVDVSAQQPSAPAAPTETKPQAPDSGAQPATPPAGSESQSQQSTPQSNPSTNTQIETRTEKSERVVEREPGKFLGVDPTVAMVIGAVLLIVIVVGMVAMSRRTEEIHHGHHHDRHRI
jgi:Protein of unknown function (DUF1180)